jgi:hypothetical protein
LPDLQVLPPEQLQVTVNAQGRRELRFSTTILNTGPVDLVVQGNFDSRTGVTSAVQVMEAADGSRVEEPIGVFVYRPEHTHWHLENFTLFELLSLREDGSLGDVLASTGKASFCALDAFPIEGLGGNDAPPPKYLSCADDLQGISSGWGDIYDASLPGQEIDIHDIPDGRYAIRTVVDPDDQIREQDTANNSVLAFIELRGFSVVVVEGP